MNAIEILKETWQEYMARRKLERTPAVTITCFPDGTLWIDELVVRREAI